ncbi:unnamed protein product [Penicillium camemberti]|uniref:Str. FM013 n=1 Tax=Penicillium camemberti (strain FM 013) TaxID=1429867 RepID=A0A0G4PDQ9_PENC3|nr:unnamed protein product [Penicillium camemberti]
MVPLLQPIFGSALSAITTTNDPSRSSNPLNSWHHAGHFGLPLDVNIITAPSPMGLHIARGILGERPPTPTHLPPISASPMH